MVTKPVKGDRKRRTRKQKMNTILKKFNLRMGDLGILHNISTLEMTTVVKVVT